MRKSVHERLSCLLLSLGSSAFAAPAAEQDLLALPLEELAYLEVSIATGSPKPLATTPAATSVITARELEAMGVQDIGEALEAVPGLHVSNGSFQYGPRYFIRGITSTYNPHTLVLINGLPQSSLFTGDRGERLPGLYSLPVKLLDRIEVIRGPGSALYGADAFAGVINLITKSPDTLKGGQASASAGSFDTYRAHVMQGSDIGAVKGLFSAAWLQTAGDDDAIVLRDAQSYYDDLFLLAPPVSQAPGAAITSARAYDLRGDLTLGGFQLRMGWMHSWDTGTGPGITDALDPGSRFEHNRGSVDLGWQGDGLAPDWELGARISYLYGAFRNDGILLYPPGAFGSFPSGLQGRPNLSEENARADFNALFTGQDSHRLRVGAGFYWGDVFKTTDVNNYFNGAPPTQRPAPADVSDTPAVFQPENQRTSYYAFVQDEWQLARAWELTAGLRYDDYSDVGGTANPRLALVWATSPTLTSKLIYGEAFRAPAFFELYGTSNPVALGNPDLKPEKLRSMELAFGWTPNDQTTWELNVYALEIQDFIDFVDDPNQSTFTARNSARIEGQGFETELRRQFGEQLQLVANYSLQHTRDQGGNRLGLAPRDEAHVRGTWAPSPQWQLTPQLSWTGVRERQKADPRGELDGYLTADLTMRHLLRRQIDLTLAVRNLFDTDVREASRGPGPNQTVPNLPFDLPQAGRSITFEVCSRW